MRNVPGLGSQIGDAAEVSLAPIWQRLYWPIFLLPLLGVAIAILQLVWRYRTWMLTALSLFRTSYCLVLIGVLLSAENLVEINVSDHPAAQGAEIGKWLSLPLWITLAVIGIACVVGIVRDAKRLLRTSLPLSAIGS